MTSRQRARRRKIAASDRIREVTSAVTPVMHAFVGISLLWHGETEILKFGGVALVALGFAASVEFALTWSFRERVEKKSDSRAKVDHLADRLSIKERIILRRRKMLTARSLSARDHLTQHAIFFYAGLMTGVLGASVTMVGLMRNAYPSVLAGSIVASIGFITLACSLVSAEANDEVA